MDPALAAKLQKGQALLQEKAKELQDLEQKMNVLLGPRAKLMAQLSENEMVSSELDVLDDEAVVYKLLGPVLVKQETAVAQSNVRSRVKYLRGQLEDIEGQEKSLRQKLNVGKQEIILMQNKIEEELKATAEKMMKK